MNTKKKSLNILELILQIIAIALLFVDGMFLISDNTTYSFSGVCSAANLIFFTLLFITLFGINAIICLVAAKSQSEDRDSILHTILPIINFIALFFIGQTLMNTVVSEVSNYVYVRSAEPLFFIELFVLLAIIILSLVKRSSSVVPKEQEKPQQIINNIKETSNADELKKYKELLDSGVITQEEFDAKKKELLGL